MRATSGVGSVPRAVANPSIQPSSLDHAGDEDTVAPFDRSERIGGKASAHAVRRRARAAS
jgi:hypothetical protein